MSKGKHKKARRHSVAKPPEEAPAPKPKPQPKPEPAGAALFKVESAPFFHRPDWIAFAAATLVTLAVYLFTLAPNVTLEDSGELATASMYAGVPHAPGYPFWTLYSWTFTKLIPFGNIAWRVGVSSAVAAALACGLTALMISRGSRLFFGSLEGLRELDIKTQRAISAAAGFAGGTIFGLTGFMWSQATIVEVYTLSTFTFAGVLCLLMRWYFIPERRWYLYATYLVFGLCLANHQTLLLAAVGIELLIFMRHREIGRDLFICNSLIYLAGLLYFSKQEGGSTTSGKLLLFGTFNLVGVGCLLLATWHSLPRPANAMRSGPILLGAAYALVFLLLSVFWVTFIWPITGGVTQSALEVMPRSVVAWDLGAVWRYDMGSAHRMVLLFGFFLAVAAVISLIWLAVQADKGSRRSLFAGACLLLFMTLGLVWMWYLLQSRGRVLVSGPPEIANQIQAQIQAQFGKANRMTLLFVLANLTGLGIVLAQNWSAMKAKAFTHWRPLLVMRAAAMAGLLFYFLMPLFSLTNPPMNWAYPRTAEGFSHAITRGQYTGPAQESTDRVSRYLLDIDSNGHVDGGQVGVFISETLQEFNPAYTLLALLPLALWWRMKDRERRWLGGLFFIFISLTLLMIAFRNPGGSEQQRHLNKVFFESSHLFVALGLGWGLALASGFIVSQWKTDRRPLLIAASTLLVLELFWWPLSQTSVSATPTSLAFALSSYDSPLLISAAALGVLLTGAVCALLLIRRPAAPLGLLLAITCFLPARHGLANWWDNELRGHYFGYWYGRDMFTTNVRDKNGDLIYPPMEHGAILFGGTDAGRFCPTYMIFCESLTDAASRTDAAFDRRDVYIITQNALADRTYLQYLRAHYNRSRQHDPPFLHSLLTDPDPYPAIDQAISNHLAYVRQDFAVKSTRGMQQVSNLMIKITVELGADKLKGMSTNTAKLPSDFIAKLIEDIEDAAKKKRVLEFNSKLSGVETQLTTWGEKANTDMTQLNEIKAATLKQRPFDGLSGWPRTLRPLDDLSTRFGNSVEQDRRTGNHNFQPSDFVDIKKLSRALLDTKNPMATHVRERLSDDTLGALDSPSPSLAGLLARDFNKIISADLQQQTKLTQKLLDLERREMEFLRQIVEAADTKQAGRVLEVIEAVLERQKHIEQLANHCQLTSKGTEPDELKKKLQDNRQLIQGHVAVLLANSPARGTEYRKIMEERRGLISRLCKTVFSDAALFEGITLSNATRNLQSQSPWTHARTTLNRRLLEDSFPGMIRRAPGGVYPALEIHIPDGDDYYTSYMRVTQEAAQPQEQMVWAINSDLTRVIFDRNPGHEFYLEESMTLPWMYPHLVPHGVILKIERQPSGEWTTARQKEIIARDRAFWGQYMDRLTGSKIVRPDTNLADICQWIHRVYLRRNHSGHTPVQRRFLRSYVAQRAFSKLRLSIAKLYDWRARNIINLKLNPPDDPEQADARARQLDARKEALLAEADYAFRQAYALCPVSAETAHEYLIFLLRNGRTKEAKLVIDTSLRLDPSDDQIKNAFRNQLSIQARTHFTFGKLISARSIVKLGRGYYRRFTSADPVLTDRITFDKYLSDGKYRDAFRHLSGMVPTKSLNRRIDWNSLITYAGILTGHLESKPNDRKLQALSAQIFRLLPTIAAIQWQYGVIPKAKYQELRGRFLIAEAKLRRQLTELTPKRPDAWYELGVTLNHLRQTNEALDCLRKAWHISGQPDTPRSIVDIRELIRTTNALNNLRETPEFKTLIKAP